MERRGGGLPLLHQLSSVNTKFYPFPPPSTEWNKIETLSRETLRVLSKSARMNTYQVHVVARRCAAVRDHACARFLRPWNAVERRFV